MGHKPLQESGDMTVMMSHVKIIC